MFQRSYRGLRILAVIGGALLVSACATGGQKRTHSGFLPNDAELQVSDKKNVAVWIAPDYNHAAYRQVVVDPVEWRAPHRDAKTEAMLREALRERLIAELSSHYEVVPDDRARPGTLRVRGAITGIRRTRWFLNAPLQVATMAAGGLGVVAPLRGGGSVEIVVDDADTRRPVVQFAAYRNGQPWNVKGSYVAYDHAQQAFGQAAEALGGYVAGRTAPPSVDATKAVSNETPHQRNR